MITLRDIKYDKEIWDKQYFEAIKSFVWAFRADVDEIVSTRSLMYPEGTDLESTLVKMLDKTIWKKYPIKNTIVARYKVNWLLKEFYWENDINMSLPRITDNNIMIKVNIDKILKFFIKPLVKSWYISDKYYLVIAPLLKTFPLWCTWRTNNIWFIDKSVKKLTKVDLINSISDISLEDILKKELEQWYTNKDIWDPNRSYAYAHSLRSNSNYYLLQWSRRVIMNWWKINVVAASKWSWKSYYAAHLCSKELLKEWTWFWWRRIRQIKYFVPDLSNVGSSVMDYMEWFLYWLRDKKLPNGKPLIEIQASKYTIKCNLTWTTFKMISLYNFWTWATWEWLACDFAVIDEAAYIPDDFWTLFSQRALMETESMFIVTTITKKTPRNHWFYKLLIDWELWSELIKSHRVDILQKRELYELNYKLWFNEPELIDNDIMNIELDRLMKFTLEELRRWWLKEYYSRAFCVILDEASVFNLTGNIVDPIWDQSDDYYVLWVDFWWNADPGSLVLVNISKHTVVWSREMKWIHYLSQVWEAKKYRSKYKNLTIIWDATTIGKVIMQEDKENVIDYWVQFTWTWTWSWNNKWFYVSSKTHLVDMCNLLLDKGILKVSSDLVLLIEQMKNFVKITGTKSLVAKYQWKGTSHDDQVDWLMMCTFLIVTILWLRELKELEDYWIEFDKQLDYEYNDTNITPKNIYSISTY